MCRADHSSRGVLLSACVCVGVRVVCVVCACVHVRAHVCGVRVVCVDVRVCGVVCVCGMRACVCGLCVNRCNINPLQLQCAG